MNIALVFMRIFFFVLSIFFMTIFMLSMPNESKTTNALIGLGLGAIFSLCLFGFDRLFRKFNLRSFNITVIGLFIGYLMGQALVLIFNAILQISSISVNLSSPVLEIIKIALFLFGTYLGTIMTLRASDELYVSIPFVKFSPTAQKKKDLLVDTSVLSDCRLIDLASSGLIDHHLVIPRFLIKELYAQAEMGEEQTKLRAKRCLETLKKLEEIPNLAIRFNDTDFPDIKDQTNKLLHLARLLDANIMTSDGSFLELPLNEEIRVISLQSLSNALKPLTQTGSQIKIKVQRYGKEPRQGVGYLEDGTMVVINGGGDFIGETIEARVLSVKHTTSGRMIFCNAIDNEDYQPMENKDENEY